MHVCSEFFGCSCNIVPDAQHIYMYYNWSFWDNDIISVLHNCLRKLKQGSVELLYYCLNDSSRKVLL